MANILTMDVQTVPINDITPYPGNARQGDHTAITESLATNGQYRPLVVQQSTGHVLCGNNTLAAARELDWDTIAIQYVDVDDNAALRILLADNRTSDTATYDDALLAELLADLPDLDGTGYTEDYLEDLLANLPAEPEQLHLDTLDEPTTEPHQATPEPEPAPAPEPTDPPQDTPQDDNPIPEPEPSNVEPDPTPEPEPEPEPESDASTNTNPHPPVLRTLALTYTPEDHHEATQLLTVVRQELDADITSEEAVLRGLRTLVSALDARHRPDATITVSELLRAAS